MNGPGSLLPMSFDGTEIDWCEVGEIARGDNTAQAWALILELLRRGNHIGFGVLDGFLSGTDLDQRVTLLEQECLINPQLRLELADTLSLDQTGTLSSDQLHRLNRAARIPQL